MIGYESAFKGKRITVVGLGLLGGVADIRFLAENGADLIVTDMKSATDAQPSLDALKDFPNIRYTLGKHDLEDFRNRDLIIKAPATPADSIYIEEARNNGIPVTMWAALFSRFARATGARIVGVTGTRGKTTTAALIAHTLRTAGKPVIEGGNVPGSSMLPQLPQLTKETVVVLELDSWKIQGFRDESISPDVSVFTTFYPDHMDYYRGDMDAYLADKAEIFLHQRPEDTLVLGEQCEAIVREKYTAQIHAKTEIAHAADIPTDWKLVVPGEHNRLNAACALHALRTLGVSDEQVRAAFESFPGVPGRLQLVRDIAGVQMYNDTTATTPEATVAALQALDAAGKKNILLIMGGADKGLSMDALPPALAAHAKRTFFLAGSGTDRVKGEAPAFDSLDKAFSAAYHVAEPGDIILLSPAFASFGMFKNEYDRGAQFNKLVAALS